MRATAAFVVHCVEEYPRFPEWATRHFGTTTRRFYLVSHAVLVPLVALVDAHSSRGRATRSKAWLATGLASTLISNAVFHAGATVAFREYSPGAASGLLVLVPVGLADITSRRHASVLGPRARSTAVTAGVVLNAVIVASLWMDMPRLDRRAR